MNDQDNTSGYALKQLNIGNSWYGRGDLEQACIYWQNVHREDSIEAYATARLNLGIVSLEKGDMQSAEVYLNQVLEQDGLKFYMAAQVTLGQLFSEKGDIKQACKYWQNVPREDSVEAYATARLNLGIVSLEKGDMQNAEVYLNQVLKEDDVKIYADAQVALGKLFDDKEDVGQARIYWGNVNPEDNKEAYVRAQYNLGNSFLKENNIKQARVYWNNIERIDKRIYAQAQFNLANSYSGENDLEQASLYLKRINPEDDAKIYTKAQYNLGSFYSIEGNLEQACVHWKNVFKKGNATAYAYAQYNLGSFYSRNGDMQKAREYWNNVCLEDDKKTYMQAQYALGYSFWIEKKREKVIEYFQKIGPEVDKKIYAQAQYGLGQLFLDKEDIKQARIHWSNVNREDHEVVYANAQYELALSSQDINLTIVYWDNFLECQNLFQSDAYINGLGVYIKQKIVICLKNNRLHLNKKNIEKIFILFDYLCKYTIDIQQKLHINFKDFKDKENCFAHYTRVEVAEKIIQNGSFHLGIANYMNDPTEGKILLNEWKIPLDYNDNSMAFLTSFTFNENSLNQFRLYGKQDGKDGSGLCLVMNHQFFDSAFDPQRSSFSNMSLLADSASSTANNFITKEKENNALSNNDLKKQSTRKKLQLFRCIYMNPETDYISIAHRSELSFYFDDTIKKPDTTWNEYIQTINQITTDIKELFVQIKDKVEQIKNVMEEEKISNPNEIYKAIATVLLPIIYLTKHAAFEEEAECRILYVTSILDDVIKKGGDRVYVEYGTNLADQYSQDGQSQNYLERIYLGPKADPRAELNLKKCWIDKMREKGMANNDIKIPTIKKSDMPLA
ncbi:TPR repeat (TPR) (PDB:1KLX) [Commensalibacter communis]|uniref:tetratricopeptide repeat protein n=1 Tax=Commensalibacter communis TaxID=2972786 RepID=UPI0022FF7881|nr:hypothetical protein [Commensalibacter communis]CAI3944600.1 TPR repeat (TPR) (PDB:1KLX) [Commensalibacter communis]